MGVFRRVCLIASLVALLVLAPATAKAAEFDPNGWTAKALTVPITAAVYVPQRNVFVATVGPFDAGAGNDLVEIDPASGAIGRRVYVGSTPDVLAVSDDGLVAYVGMADTDQIAQVDLVTFLVVRTFRTNPRQSEYHVGVPRDIVVQPGRDDTIVVALMDPNLSPSEEGVTAYRDGVPLPNAITSGEIDDLQMLDVHTVFAEGPHATSDLLHLDDSGLTVTRHTDDYLSGRVWYGPVKPAGSNLATVSGHLIDPQTETVVQSYGNQFDHNNLGAFSLNPAGTKVVYLDDMHTGQAGTKRFVEYDVTTGVELARHEFRDVSDPQDLVASTTNALVITKIAFQGSWSLAYLVGPSVVPGPITSGPGAPSIIDGFSTRLLPYHAVHLLEDTRLPLLYATTETGVVAIDPVTGVTVHNLALAGSPWALAESDDGSTLYVTLSATGDVVRMSLLTFTEVSRFNLGLTDYPGEIMWGHDIEVRPGTDNEVAIAQAGSGSPIHKGVALFVDGERRPLVTQVHDGPDYIEFRDASTLVGGTVILHVDDDGVTCVSDCDNGSSDFELDVQGRELSQWGGLWDPVAHQLDGVYGGPETQNLPGGVEAAPLVNRLYQVDDNLWGGIELHEYELNTFRRIGTRVFPEFDGWGRDLVTVPLGFATTVDQGILLLTRPTCAGLLATISGAGTITGTSAADVIVGSVGNDVIDGLGGNDVICGGDGNDILRSGLGNDFLDGGAGKDYLAGGSGSQVLRGGDGDDVLKGLGGNDRLSGGDGADRLFGGAGSDVLVGGDGVDACGVVERTDVATLCESRS